MKKTYEELTDSTGKRYLHFSRSPESAESPIMITKIENSVNEQGKNINYSQFERQALIHEDGSKVGYGTLETSIIEQYRAAITEAKRIKLIDMLRLEI